MIRLKDLRISINLTQKELAQKLGCNQTAVGKYERGYLEPNIETLIKLAKIFEVSVDYLLGREDDFGNVTITGTAPALSNEEERLLKAFRKLDASERDKIISDAEFFANRYTVPSFGKNRA